MKHLTLTISFILISFCCLAQYTVTGRVINQADTKPLINASVFISNATIGDHTAADGSFKLNNVKPGTYKLVVSNIGFDTYTQPIIITNHAVNLQTITIYPKSIALAGVTIKARAGADPDRSRYISLFDDEFLGKSDLARECKILNPDMLDFSYDGVNNILTASSVDFLTIQNDALGYKLKYLLKNFTLNFAGDGSRTFSYSGSVLFEPMNGSPGEERQWLLRRQEVYEGSQMHFLRSATADALERDGFRVQRVPANPQRPAGNIIREKLELYNLLKSDKQFRDSLNYWEKKANLPRLLDKPNPQPLKKQDMITGPDGQGLFALGVNGDGLFISYNKYHHYNHGGLSMIAAPDNKDNTLMVFNSPAVAFDKNGSLLDPALLAYEGVWSNNRVSALLPSDYEPEQTMETEVDSTVVKTITAKVSAYKSTHVTEKAYLHFDKPYYSAGDTIYFKAYLTEGATHAPSRLSRVLYVDLIDADNKIKRSEKLQVTDGVAWGDFALAQTLPKGNYRVRAYTQWMRNEGDAAFFDKTIPVASLAKVDVPESGVPVQKAAISLKPDFKFFPEAGKLIAGTQCKMAFKAIGANGLGVDVKGTVVDNENREITTFESTHLGMGYFYFTPSAAKTYTAKIIYADNTQDTLTLPRAGTNEIGLSFTDGPRAWSAKISSGKLWYQQNKNKSYTLVIYSGGVPHSFTVKLASSEINLDILKNDFPSGIATATLFSAVGEPLCERLLFVQNNDQLKLSIGTAQKTYAVRSKTSITLNIKTNTGQPAQGHFSVAVIDEARVPLEDNSESTIINNLLLTSDLKGFVEQPAYYFTSPNEKTTADLDLVMLTHGYRDFEWHKMLKPANTVLAWQPEKGLTISGTVKRSGSPVENGSVRLLSKAAGGMVLDTVTNKNGRFTFDNMAYDDTTRFVVQARTATGVKDVEVRPDSLVAVPAVAIKNIPGPQLTNSLAVYAQNNRQFLAEQERFQVNKNGIMLREVNIKDKKIDPFQHSANLNGAGNADQTITAEYLENSGYTTLYDALRAKLSFIKFTDRHKLISNRTTSFQGSPDYMVIIVDGTPHFESEYKELDKTSIRRGVLDDYAAADIESVEVLLGTHYGAIYGATAASGAIIVTTKRAKKINNYYKEAPGVITIKPNGFYKARQFYAPKYDPPEIYAARKDLRSTIYWNPEVTTDDEGNASFSYFNADGTGNYQVVIEGIDEKGNLGRQVYHYKVE